MELFQKELHIRYPMYDITADNSDNSVFKPRIESNPEATSILSTDFDQIGTEASEDFWTILVYSSYQKFRLADPFPPPFNTSSDADPPDTNGDGNPNGCPEANYGSTNVPPPNAIGVYINLEVSRPREYPLDYLSRPVVSRAMTVAHEVGHLFRADHPEGGIM